MYDVRYQIETHPLPFVFQSEYFSCNLKHKNLHYFFYRITSLTAYFSNSGKLCFEIFFLNITAKYAEFLSICARRSLTKYQFS